MTLSASDSSLEYLRTLRTYSIESVLYDDNLNCSLPNKEEVGSFEIKISKTTHGSIDNCIQVIANR